MRGLTLRAYEIVAANQDTLRREAIEYFRLEQERRSRRARLGQWAWIVYCLAAGAVIGALID